MHKTELLTLLRSAKTIEEIDKRREEIAELLPFVERMFDYDQKNPKQLFDLWTHSVKTVVNLPRDLEDCTMNNMMCLGALLHDIGKPDCQGVKSKRGREEVVYEGHAQRGVEILEQEIFPKLDETQNAFTEDEKRLLKYYVGYHHDMPRRMKWYVRRHMMMVNVDELCNLFTLGIADCKAQGMYTGTKDRVRIYEYLLSKSDDGFITIFIPTKWWI